MALKKRKRARRLGPGLLVTAAFIGPGTVTTASLAGVNYKSALLWCVAFSTIATIILQEMAARLGLVARQDLGQAVRTSLPTPLARNVGVALVLLAVFFGNSAYQTGNLTGAAMGLELLSPLPLEVWVLVTSASAAALLLTGIYRSIERALVLLVVCMSIVFVLSAVLARPDAADLLRGATQPSFPPGSLPVVIGLIGTTVVPYNLFLHSAAVQQRWSVDEDVRRALSESRLDAALSIGLGGIVTAAIVVTGAAVPSGHGIANAADMARQLQPLLGGRLAQGLFAVGLFAAGLTSAVTAPLAAAFATSGVLGWPADLKSTRFRAVWAVVLGGGTVLAVTLGKSPTQTILLAQIANGLLLPVIAVLLLAAVNRRSLMGTHANGLVANALGGAVVLFAAALGGYHVLNKLAVL